MLLSIHLNSNRPQNLKDLVKNIEDTASQPAEIEVIVNIDDGDDECKKALESLQRTSSVKIKFLQTNLIKSFKDVWKPYNEILKLTDSTSYFVTLFSDEFRFKTQQWDKILKEYISYYEDDIFRIRLSRYRFRNYSDSWECMFAPDSLAIYTKKWMDIVGQWCPCTGPDSWQQLVSFYLTNSRKFDHIQYIRDVADSFIEFDGEGASAGLVGLKARQRIKDNVDLWFEETSSHAAQEKANYAAAMLQTGIILHESNDERNITSNFLPNRRPPVFGQKKVSEISFKNNEEEKRIDFFYQENLIYKISYKINKLQVFLIRNFRKINYPFYAGGGEEVFRKNIVNAIYTYYRIRKYGDFGYKEFVKIQQPKLLQKYDLKIIRTTTKALIVTLKLCRILLLKITFCEKYYRLAKRRIHKKKCQIKKI